MTGREKLLTLADIERTVEFVREVAESGTGVEVGVDIRNVPGDVFDELDGSIIRDEPVVMMRLFHRDGFYVHASRARNLSGLQRIEKGAA